MRLHATLPIVFATLALTQDIKSLNPDCVTTTVLPTITLRRPAADATNATATPGASIPYVAGAPSYQDMSMALLAGMAGYALVLY